MFAESYQIASYIVFKVISGGLGILGALAEFKVLRVLAEFTFLGVFVHFKVLGEEIKILSALLEFKI